MQLHRGDPMQYVAHCGVCGEDLPMCCRTTGTEGWLAIAVGLCETCTEKRDREIERLRAAVTEGVDTFTQNKCLWDWVHRMRCERGLSPLREYEQAQPIVDAQADEIERLRNWKPGESTEYGVRSTEEEVKVSFEP